MQKDRLLHQTLHNYCIDWNMFGPALQASWGFTTLSAEKRHFEQRNSLQLISNYIFCITTKQYNPIVLMWLPFMKQTKKHNVYKTLKLWNSSGQEFHQTNRTVSHTLSLNSCYRLGFFYFFLFFYFWKFQYLLCLRPTEHFIMQNLST